MFPPKPPKEYAEARDTMMKDIIDRMAKGTFKFYDVESGTEKAVEHGPECPCGTCSKERLRSTLDDIIKGSRAHAPASKRRAPRTYGGEKVKPEWWEDEIKVEKDAYHDFVFKAGKATTRDFTKGWDINDQEGKCFGWNPEADEQVVPVRLDINYRVVEEELYMILTDKPMSPDMTKQDMAVMSVDQQKAVLTLKVLYNPFFNQRLKTAIEPKYRNWNTNNKCWELHPSKMKDVQEICKEFYKGVQIIGQKPVLGTKFEKLLSRLSKDDKASIYRLMALKYHPDKGGDHETMSLINEVFKQ